MKRMLLALLGMLLTMSGFAQDYKPKDFSHLIGTPGFSNELLQMHFKLYQGYVTNTNVIMGLLKTYAGNTQAYQYQALKRRFGWEFDGMRLHELYFENMGGKKAIDPSSPLYKAIEKDFGSFDGWKKDFIATGLMRGVGWSILYFDPIEGRLVNTWINEHDGGHLATGEPILVMDVWEHAYITQYALDRAKYIDAFFNTINWEVVTGRFNK